MTTWLISTNVGSDDESAWEADDDGVEEFALSTIREADMYPDGTVFQLRKANYLRVPGRPKLTLLQGGLSA